MTDLVFTQLQELGADCTPCGSRVTCSPPPTDTDQDYLVVVPDEDEKVGTAVEILHENSFNWEGSEHYQMAADNFMSWRKGDVNLIVTRNNEFARKHKAATALAKRLNLMDKADRVALFQAVLYGNTEPPTRTAGAPSARQLSQYELPLGDR